MNDILYNPNLKYDKSYFTKEKFTDNEQILKDDEEVFITRINGINNTVNRIKNNINYIPEEISNTYLPAFIVMNKEFSELISNEINEINPIQIPEDKPSDEPTIDSFPNDNKPDNKDDNIPTLFDREGDIYIETSDPWANPVTVFETNFLYNFIDIYEDYVKNLDNIINDYIVTTLNAVSVSTTMQDFISYKTKDIANTDLHHLSDFLTKGNIMLDQKLRLHKKLFQLDEIILHVKKIRVSKQELLRYIKANELKQNDFLDIDSNILLKESRRVAEKKYENSLYDLYKYLNSSVILMKEALNLILKQNKSIMTINKYR